MSGTSLDGLDIAFCSFTERSNDPPIFHINACRTYPYPLKIRDLLAIALECDACTLISLNNKYGIYLAEKIQEFLQETGMGKPDLIASHGHTLFHQPPHYTFQIGSGSCIAALTGIPTVCDFRSTDLALGGQGAPLVPVGDRDLFPEYQACLNLGGIANISFEKEDKRIAYDICPVNLPLNYLSSKLGFAFDEDGKIAASAKPDKDLLNKLNTLQFYELDGAKSLGREWFETHFIPLVDTVPTEIALATVSLHIVKKLCIEFSKNSLGQVLVTGGGARNTHLMNGLRSVSATEIAVPENNIVDFKEALIFAYLGYLRIQEKTNVLASVTGASKDSSSGALYLP